MKKYLFFFAMFVVAMQSRAQVAINNTNATPNNYAMLDVSATQKGVLIPRITTADRTTMAGSMGATEEGLTVYDTDLKSFWFWDGSAWIAVGNGAMSDDKDWFKEGTTDAPSDNNDSMFHQGKVAIGTNTANAQLDLQSTTEASLFKAKLSNPNDIPLRLGASVDVDGTAITTHGKVGVYATVGGDPGSASYSVLEGFESAVIGQNGVDKDQYGLYTYVTGDNNGNHVGLSTYLDGNGTTGARYANLNQIAGSGNGINYLYYGMDRNNGDGIHFGNYFILGGSGNGIQYGNFNYISNSGSNKKFGTFNNIYSKSTSAQTGTTNMLGIHVDPSNPYNVNIITGDSDGKRLGSLNLIAGDGNGLHVGASNNIISTGDGFHVGIANNLGRNYATNTNTATSGYQLGILNNITDTGNAAHVGSSNLLGIALDPNDPTNPIPVSGDSDAKRIGAMNTIGGDGNGQDYGVINTLVSSGSGEQVGTSNAMGYDFRTHTAVNSAGDHVGTLNALNATGDGKHFGMTNFIGYDHINHTELNSNGLHVGTLNLLAGGQSTANGIAGLQVGTSNVIVAKTDSSVPIILGAQFGSMNIIGRDPNNPLAGTTNNGDGDHIATYNEVIDSGNGKHVASYNKVGADGTGQHIAVYGEVDSGDVRAMAGAFKGYTTATNQVSTISLYAANEYIVNNTTMQDLTFMEAGFDPRLYNQLGLLEVKLVIRVSSASGSGNKFKLRALNNSGTEVFPISDTDTWTWTETDTTNHKYVVTSEWKSWNAGTSPWELHLQGITDAQMKIVNVYIMVRPVQM